MALPKVPSREPLALQPEHCGPADPVVLEVSVMGKDIVWSSGNLHLENHNPNTSSSGARMCPYSK